MRAVRFHGKEDLRVEEVAEPEPGPGEVKLRNAFAGICGSDLHVYYEPEQAGLDLNRPHPVTGATPPQILGHEFAGTVVGLGEGVTSVEIGDRVAVWPVYYCGECPACRKGLYNACRKIGFHGLTSHGGGMAEYTTVTADRLHTLPDQVDLVLGAMVEPMAVAWHAVELSGIQAGQRALIAGSGPIGIGVWFALRARGVETIIVSEPSAPRRAAIARLGAEPLVDPAAEDLPARVDQLTSGYGVDAAFDAAGAGPAVTGAIASLTPRGVLVVVALHERAHDFNPTVLVMSETELRGSLAYLPADFDAVIEAMAAGAYTTDGWVEQVGLAQAEDAIHRLRAGQGMKILVGS